MTTTEAPSESSVPTAEATASPSSFPTAAPTNDPTFRPFALELVTRARTPPGGRSTLTPWGEGYWRAYAAPFELARPYEAMAFTEPFYVSSAGEVTIELGGGKTSYAEGDVVSVNFANPTGRKFWVGVRDADADPDNLDQSGSEDYVWGCGTKTCDESAHPVGGTLDFDSVGEGYWRAYIISWESSFPYQVMAFTEPFTVVTSEEGRGEG